MGPSHISAVGTGIKNSRATCTPAQEGAAASVTCEWVYGGGKWERHSGEFHRRHASRPADHRWPAGNFGHSLLRNRSKIRAGEASQGEKNGNKWLITQFSIVFLLKVIRKLPFCLIWSETMSFVIQLENRLSKYVVSPHVAAPHFNKKIHTDPIICQKSKSDSLILPS